jgi:hypothetical protein
MMSRTHRSEDPVNSTMPFVAARVLLLCVAYASRAFRIYSILTILCRSSFDVSSKFRLSICIDTVLSATRVVSWPSQVQTIGDEVQTADW